MKRLFNLSLLAFLFLHNSLMAQNDSIRLYCPLNEAVVVPPPKNTMTFDIPDLCIVLASIPDTIVKACVVSRVTNVTQNEDDGGRWEVVIFSKYKNKEYYFWYSGLETILVKRNEVLKVGQPMGFIKPGGKIELLMYDFETQVDPTKYLDCKGVLKNTD